MSPLGRKDDGSIVDKEYISSRNEDAIRPAYSWIEKPLPHDDCITIEEVIASTEQGNPRSSFTIIHPFTPQAFLTGMRKGGHPLTGGTASYYHWFRL